MSPASSDTGPPPDVDPELLCQALHDALRTWDAASGQTRWRGDTGGLGVDRAALRSLDAWMEAIVLEDRARVAAAFRALRSGAITRWTGEYRVVRRDGAILHVVDRAVGAADGATGVAVLRDVSEQRRAERAMAEVETTLEQVHALERRVAHRDADTLARARAAREAAEIRATTGAAFVAELSHELRTPLNAVIGLSSVLAETQLDPDQRELAETIQRSGDHLLHLIEDVLDLSKIEAGKLVLERAPFGVRAVVEEALDMVAASAAEAGLDLGYTMAPGTAAGIIGDAKRLRQILLNLLANATKFTRQGEVRLDVRSRQRPDGRVELHVAVRDTGPGIAPDRLRALFQPFTQESADTARRFGGTGLGLVITRRLVEAMEGSIELESVPGRGTVARFRLVALPVGWPDPGAPEGVVDELAGRRIGVEVASPAERQAIGALLDRWGAVAVPSSAAEHLDAVVADEHVPPTGRPWVALRRMGTRSSRGSSVARPLKPAALLAALRGALAGVQPSSAPTRSTPPRPSRALDVLVVDDDRVNRRVAEILLQRAGHRATSVEDGEAALSLLAERSVDVVLLDLEMPRMGGLELARRVLLGHRPPAVVALTADATPEARRTCSALGVVDFLTKPVTPERLAKALAAVARVSHRPDTAPTVLTMGQLRADLGDDGAALVLDIFIQDTPVALGRLRAAIDDGDMRAVVKLTHTLKAACSLFGVPELVARLEAAESAARRSEPGAAALAAAAIPGVECLVDAVRRDRQADEGKAR